MADESERYLCFKTSPYIFGGSRYNFGGVDEIKLDKAVFIEILKKAQGTKTESEQEIKEPIEIKTPDEIQKTKRSRRSN